ncbi:MAG TPA: hypothetical protein VGD22_17065 [Sphingobacteriaceae bacterium]
MLEIYNNTKVYIFCPPNFATGGTELLHQLSYKLNKVGITTFMYYVNAPNSTPQIHPQFIKYNPIITDEIVDEPQNILITPEIYIDFRLDKFKKIRKVIWWLSVDFYLDPLLSKLERKQKKPFFHLKKLIGRYKFADMNFLKKRKFYHLVQSQYAKSFLQQQGIHSLKYLSDYLNSTFFNQISDPFKKEDIIAYNPKKGFEFTSRLISAAPNFNWLALENMSPEEVKNSLSKSKVYIDFGNHPGKDRFPREAAMMGCCIITGRRGAAKNEEDIPLLEEFKFDEATSDIHDIITKIEQCIVDYEHQCIQFEDYRNKIKQEEENFDKDLTRIFIKTVS